MKKLQTVGKPIGSGAFKTCYLLGKNKVALVSDGGDRRELHQEFSRFQKLKKLGVKIPPVQLTHVLVGKRKRVALVMPRYKHHSRDRALEDYVTKKMLKCLEDLYFKLKKAQVCSYDMQFVWNTTDKILLTDPGSFSGHVKDENNECLWEIANFINIFRKRFKFKTLIPQEILDKSEEYSYGDLG